MSTITAYSATSIVLTGSNDWFKWFNIIKARAIAAKVWKYADPDSATELLPKLTPYPTIQDAKDLKTEDGYTEFTHKEALTYLISVHTSQEKTYTREIQSLQTLLSEIQRTVSEVYIMYITSCSSSYQALRSLKAQIAPTPESRYFDIDRQYRTLIQGKPKGQPIEQWLQRWEKVFVEAEEIEHSDFKSTIARVNFIQSTHSLDPSWSGIAKYNLQTAARAGQPTQTFHILLADFKQSHRTLPAIQHSNSAFPATLQGRTTDGKPTVPNTDFRPTCPIDRKQHYYGECPYLNESARPTDFIGKPELLTKATQFLLRHPGIAEKIQERNTRSNQPGLKATEVKSRTYAAYCPKTFNTMSTSDTFLQTSWILDSGSNIHLCNDPQRFTRTHPATEQDVVCSGKDTYQIEAFGIVDIAINTPHGTQAINRLVNVALVPGFLTNLVSLGKMVESNLHWNTKRGTLYSTNIAGVEDHFCQLTYLQGHWIMENNTAGSASIPTAMIASTKTPRQPKTGKSIWWHQAMGHPNYSVIQRLPTSTLDCYLIDTPSAPESCETCMLSKASRIISRRSTREHESTRPLQRLHYDLIQMDEASNGDCWASHFVCSYTSYHWLWTHRTKGQATSYIDRMIKLAINQYQRPIQYLHSDGEKALGDVFQQLIKNNGIVWEFTAPYTSDQNGLAERSGGVITTKARAMSIGASIPLFLWNEVISTAAYLLNRTPIRQRNWKTPFELLYNKPPSLAHIHIFGCRAYPLNNTMPKRQKLSPRAHLGYLMGYDSTNIYRIWIPAKNRVIRTRDVTFNENLFYDPAIKDLTDKLSEAQLHKEIHLLDDLVVRPLADNQSIDEPVVIFDNDSENHAVQATKETTPDLPRMLMTPPATPAPAEVTTTTTAPADLAPSASAPTSASEPTPQAPRHGWTYEPSTNLPSRVTEITSDLDTSNIITSSRRTKDRKQAHAVNLSQLHLCSGFHYAFAADHGKKVHQNDLPPEPKNWKQLQSHPHATQFKQAADLEYSHLMNRQTFKPVDQQRHNVIPLLWVFKYKFDTDGYLVKHKARLCVRGDLQKTAEDTTAATLAIKVFRALMAITAVFDLEAKQYDAINAFINAEINETIHVSYPDGYKNPAGSSWSTPKCLLLLRGLYGLKQSPLLWLRHLTRTLLRLGLTQVPGINCLFKNDWLILFFYVDDIVVLYHKQHRQQFQTFEDLLIKSYELRSLGDISWFLGIRIIRNREERTIHLCQDSYIEKIAARFAINQSTTKVPLPSGDILPYDEQATADQIYAYQQRIGSLTFAATTTRPDIAFACSRLAQHLQNPSPKHTQLANQVLAYLLNTKTLSIKYCDHPATPIFTPSSDAAFADDQQTRKSSFGYLFQLYGGPIDWKASKQITVTTSSTEAELLALSETARQCIWWMNFFRHIQFDLSDRTPIRCDNQQTLGLVNNEMPRLSTRLKHIEVHDSWLRQEIQTGNISTVWVSTNDMAADGFTKILPYQKHQHFIDLLHLYNP